MYMFSVDYWITMHWPLLAMMWIVLAKSVGLCVKCVLYSAGYAFVRRCMTSGPVHIYSFMINSCHGRSHIKFKCNLPVLNLFCFLQRA